MRKNRFTCCLLLWVALLVTPSLHASDFVGVLALALEEEVANQLELSPQVRTRLRAIVDRRESEALELAYELRDLTRAEQEQKLAPFRAASEKEGLELLTKTQRLGLAAVQLGRRGLDAVIEPKTAQRLQLTPMQLDQLKRLLAERDLTTANLDRRLASRERKKYELQMQALLTDEQQETWNTMTTVSPTKPDTSRSTKRSLGNGTTDEATGDGRLRFSFRYAPWAEVIEWFADQAGLSLVMDAPPQGTLNYSDPRDYSAAQAIDLLNSVLLTKGYTLVRRDRMLMVVNLEDGIPPNLITEVRLEDLDARGEYELVRCLFTLKSAVAADVEQELSRLIGPQGTVAVLDSSNQLVITETAGRLRTFRTIIEAAERKLGAAMGQPALIRLEYARSRDVVATWRKLLGLTDEENATQDGSLRVAAGKSSRELVVTGLPHRVQEFRELVQLLDVSTAGGHVLDVPQLDVYPVTDADPNAVLEVLQTLLEGEDDVRLASDPKTGNLVALARPDQHRTIKATVEQMQRDRRQVEVIRLRMVDPQLAMMSIEKLFGAAESEEETPNNGPRVDADPITRSLLIRGSSSQIAEIRALLAKMGEREPEEGDRSLSSGRGNLRMIPIDAGTARRALGQLQNLWPSVRSNPIRVVTPAASIREFTPQDSLPTEDDAGGDNPRSTSLGITTSRFVATQADTAVERTADLPAVVVTVGERGLLIASEDVKALDDFEQMFRTLSDRLFTGSSEMAVFYLKYAKADVAAELIRQFLGGGASSSGGTGGSLLGTLAGAALGGGEAGGLIGSLLGGAGSAGSTRVASGTAIIADPRLNALVVQAPPKDLDFIEQLLKVLDTPAGPEPVETIPRPRTILVQNTNAEDVAAVVRSVYASRLDGQGNTPRQPTPEEFLRAMSGQKNTGRAIKDSVGEQMRMNISVDTRRNALIVVAPESLFREVEALVAQLDFPTPDLQETIRYGQTASSSPELIRNALTSIMGEEAGSTPTSRQEASPSKPSKSAPQRADGLSPEQIKRRMEFIKAIQRANSKKAEAAKAAAKKK